jgi:hypothetical protein
MSQWEFGGALWGFEFGSGILEFKTGYNSRKEPGRTTRHESNPSAWVTSSEVGSGGSLGF